MNNRDKEQRMIGMMAGVIEYLLKDVDGSFVKTSINAINAIMTELDYPKEILIKGEQHGRQKFV